MCPREVIGKYDTDIFWSGHEFDFYTIHTVAITYRRTWSVQKTQKSKFNNIEGKIVFVTPVEKVI